MIELNSNYNRLVGDVLEYVRMVVDVAIKNNWKIIIWGFGRGGKFLRHLIQDFDGRVVVDFIINEKLRMSYDSEPAIYYSSLLEYIKPSECIILSTIKHPDTIMNIVKRYGYIKNKNFFDVFSDIGDSYIENIERKYTQIDFKSVFATEITYEKECNEHIPFGYSCVDNVFMYIVSLEDKISFFDFGCGKGAAILMAYLHGITRLGGVELIKDIYEQAKINMEILNIDCNLLYGNATECEIDDYNCFFFYNPFQGEIFEKVICNIEKSFDKHKRNIYLVYANPFEHKTVIRNGMFKLYEQIRVDLFDPLLNIYEIEG